ncbi:MAG: WG repeat-containing protein [Planctomycetota bacterium]
MKALITCLALTLGLQLCICQSARADDLLPVCVNGKFGFIDRSGTIVVKPTYDGAGVFSEGLCAVCLGGTWGYLGRDGEVAIPLAYDSSGEFFRGRARIWLNGQCGCIDTRGRLVVPPRYQSIRMDECGFMIASGWDRGGNLVEVMFDRDGHRAFPGLQLPASIGFSEGLMAAGKRDENAAVHWGFINTAGEFVIDATYDWCGWFSDGLAHVTRDGQTGFIDRAGNVVVPFKFASVAPFSHGRAFARETNSRWMVIDREGNQVGQQWYSAFVRPFYGGIGMAHANKGIVYVGRNGLPINDQRYEKAWPFQEGRAAVEIDGKIGFIDEDGRMVIKPQFELMSEPPFRGFDGAPVFSGGFAAVWLDKKVGYIDLAGNWIYKPTR